METGQLELAAWKVSGKSTLQKVFQNGLRISCWQDGAKGPIQHTMLSAWNKWTGWCSSRQINPFSTDIQYFLDFLAELFEAGLQYRSINTVRSAVSMTHVKVEGTPIGQHPLVSRLLKGIYNSRPPQPRYQSTWDVDVVVKFVVSLGANDQLSLKHLSWKLAVLMALIEAIAGHRNYRHWT